MRFRRGFTLIEVIIYVALLGILLAGALTSAFALIDGNERNARAIQVREEVAFIQQKIRWALSNATSISVSADGKNLTIYRMEGEDFNVSDNPIRFYLEDGFLLIQRASREPLPLNADRFTPREFEVERMVSGVYNYVRVTFEIDGEVFSASYSIKI
ncbi:prepilin-type N-terminal cleavage/methylation domain-containing protein [Candidatus Parcubacteria bacterium]|nr:MAG: prepilin-type N-terminal cleavage/methylation domain-containing protein [Candidatus Parcubacteria bacterium]